ncbi:hypothetical protein KXX21_007130 [Aspergillus fumigatus]|nr:hypothetical protein KXX21_007130 [Aspergillus fumigatus]KMK56433.1 hypothetical protein Y699_05348 [Aspergillus fumigatus Z5]
MPGEHASKGSSSTSSSAESANCKRVSEPSKMRFIDHEGVRHEICLPKGTFKMALAHYLSNNFDELAKYPPSADLEYEEENEKGN